MATRSAIGFVEYDGSVTGIYCHWDGNLESVGQTLVCHYNDIYKALELIELGDISSLGSEIGEKHPFSRFDTVSMTDEEYNNLYGNMTTAYTRDRDANCPAKDFESAKAFRSHYSDCEYFYLYDGKEWTYADRKMPYFKSVPMMVEA